MLKICLEEKSIGESAEITTLKITCFITMLSLIVTIHQPSMMQFK